jgi:peptidoglycan hydrolase FlgJ
MKVNSLKGPQIEADTNDFQKEKLKKACEDFEAIMVTYLFKSMRETALRAEPESDEFGSSRGLYEGMMDETLANQLSHQEGMGLARILYHQLAPLLDGQKIG